MQVDFYHLTATPLERALPQIAAKVVECLGQKGYVYGGLQPLGVAIHKGGEKNIQKMQHYLQVKLGVLLRQ